MEVDMKKALFFCNTHMQFIIALVIRNTKLEEYYCTLILGGTIGLKNLYDYNYQTLNSYFQEVYWSDNSKWAAYYRQTEFDSNEKLIDEFGQDFSDYSDIFFHNRIGALQSILRNKIKDANAYNLHHFEEGRSIYLSGDSYLSRRDIADDTDKNRRINDMYYNRFDYSDLNCDVYLCNPDLAVHNIKRKMVKILEGKIAEKEKDAILSCYSAKELSLPSINEKVIFLGGAHDTQIGKDCEYVEVINKIAEVVGYENFLYKAHPRSPIAVGNVKIKTFVDSLPIELYELRGELKDKILITSLSGALCTIKYFFQSSAKVIFLYPMFKKDYPAYDEKIVIEYINKLNTYYGGVHLTDSLDELKRFLTEKNT